MSGPGNRKRSEAPGERRGSSAVHEATVAKARQGYFAKCPCGWASPGGMRVREAQAAAETHNRTEAARDPEWWGAQDRGDRAFD